MPSSRSSATASKASTSPRSSPANRKPLASTLLGQVADDDPLVHARGAHLDHVAAGLLDQAVALGEVAQPRLEPVVRRGRVVEPPRVDGDGQALVLDEGVGGVRLAQHPRQVTQEAGQPLGRAGRDHAALGGAPALVAVLPEHEQLPPGVTDLLAHLVEPAEGERLARGPAGDHRDGADHLGQVHQDGGGIRVDVGDLGVVDDRRQGAVVVQADHGRTRPRRPARRTALRPRGT